MHKKGKPISLDHYNNSINIADYFENLQNNDLNKSQISYVYLSDTYIYLSRVKYLIYDCTA